MRQPVPFGKYLLLDRISVGGMAEVFKAKSYGVEGFEKIIAIKRILPTMGEDRDFIKMFIDEAKIAGQLAHANICQIFELGRIDGAHFIAMEYIWGKDLLQIQNRLRKLKQPMPISMACFMIAKVLEGLDYAHRKRDPLGRPLEIVHRDCSPQNVLVSYEGEVKVIDFGIAKATSRNSRTMAGVLKGKFGYMSPEQVRGLPLDRRSDLFALGTMLYECLTSERLFQGETDFSTLEKVRNVDIRPPRELNPNIPEAIEKVILKALAKDVDDRYQWCSEMLADIQQYLMSQDIVFTAKSLAGWLKDAFSPEIDRERALLETYKRVGRDGLIAGVPSAEAKVDMVESLGEAPEPEGDSTQLGGPSFEDLEQAIAAGASPQVGPAPGSPAARGALPLAASPPPPQVQAKPLPVHKPAARAGSESDGDFGEEAPTEIFGDADPAPIPANQPQPPVKPGAPIPPPRQTAPMAAKPKQTIGPTPRPQTQQRANDLPMAAATNGQQTPRPMAQSIPPLPIPPVAEAVLGDVDEPPPPPPYPMAMPQQQQPYPQPQFGQYNGGFQQPNYTPPQSQPVAHDQSYPMMQQPYGQQMPNGTPAMPMATTPPPMSGLAQPGAQQGRTLLGNTPPPTGYPQQQYPQQYPQQLGGYPQQQGYPPQQQYTPHGYPQQPQQGYPSAPPGQQYPQGAYGASVPVEPGPVAEGRRKSSLGRDIAIGVAIAAVVLSGFLAVKFLILDGGDSSSSDTPTSAPKSTTIRVAMPPNVNAELFVDDKRIATVSDTHDYTINAKDGVRKVKLLAPNGAHCEKELKLPPGETTALDCPLAGGGSDAGSGSATPAAGSGSAHAQAGAGGTTVAVADKPMTVDKPAVAKPADPVTKPPLDKTDHSLAPTAKPTDLKPVERKFDIKEVATKLPDPKKPDPKKPEIKKPDKMPAEDKQADATPATGKGYLTISSTPRAKILIDGVDSGMSTPIGGHALSLAPGRHKITFIVGEDRFTFPTVIKSGQTESMNKDLQ